MRMWQISERLFSGLTEDETVGGNRTFILVVSTTGVLGRLDSIVMKADGREYHDRQNDFIRVPLRKALLDLRQ